MRTKIYKNDEYETYRYTEAQKLLNEEQIIWGDVIEILAFKFIPTPAGDMYLDSEEVIKELSEKFELKRRV